jgi:hypothetical protein
VSVFDETPAEGAAASRAPLVVAGLVALLVAGSAIWMLSRDGEERPATTAAPATPTRPAPESPVATAPAAPTSESAPRRPAAPAPTEPAAAPVATAPRANAATLVVESDVAGASVFVDREFVGTAPVTLRIWHPDRNG